MMRTPALAIALSVCLAATAAQAVCTSGVDCIRERFGPNPVTRNNQIIDRTDRLGDRNRPVNPYVARQGLRVGPNNRTIYGPVNQQSELQSLQPNQLRPDVRYTPGATPGMAADPSAAGAGTTGRWSGQGLAQQQGALSDPTVGRYDPALPATGPSASGMGGMGAAPSLRRDPNAPAAAADGFYAGPRAPGATR